VGRPRIVGARRSTEWPFTGYCTNSIVREKEEAYATERLNRAAIEGSGVTLRHFRRAGAFEDARTADAFGAAGFMP
jgi:hypothetical protein